MTSPFRLIFEDIEYPYSDEYVFSALRVWHIEVKFEIWELNV